MYLTPSLFKCHHYFIGQFFDLLFISEECLVRHFRFSLGTCWVCHFKPEVAQEQFNLPKGVYPYHILVCGYPADHIADPEHREARTIPLSDFLLK